MNVSFLITKKWYLYIIVSSNFTHIWCIVVTQVISSFKYICECKKLSILIGNNSSLDQCHKDIIFNPNFCFPNNLKGKSKAFIFHNWKQYSLFIYRKSLMLLVWKLAWINETITEEKHTCSQKDVNKDTRRQFTDLKKLYFKCDEAIIRFAR